MSDERLLELARRDMDNLVELVLHDINKTAYRLHYDREWVIAEFRKKFNEAVRNIT